VRIGFDLTPWFHPHTGIGLCTREVVAGARAAGHEVTGLVSAWRRRADPPGEALPPVARLWTPRMLTPLLFDGLGWPTVESKLGRLDRYVATNYILPPAREARCLALVHDLGPLTHPHLYRHRRVARFRTAIRRCARHAALLVAPSEATVAEIVRVGLAPEGRIRVLPLAGRRLPAHGAPPAGLPRDAPLLLCLATRDRRKNLAQVLQAFSRAAEAVPHHLAVAGLGGERAAPFRAALAGSARPRVHFLGGVDDGALGALYRAAEITICASLLEGFGLPLLEAMAQGSAVLASDLAAHREVAADAACYVPAGDCGALVEGIVELARDGDRRRALCAKGAERAAAFSWESTRARFEALLSG